MVAVLCGITAFAVQLLAGWPGWLSADSAAMLTQAETGAYTDAYSPSLSWAWSLLQPDRHGPLIPFLLQLELFWTGVVLAAIGVQPAARWTRFLPLLLLLNPVVWMVVVVSPAAAVLSLVTLSLGIAALAVRSYRRGSVRGARIALFGASVTAGVAAVGHPAMLPLVVLLVLALCLALLPRQLGARQRLDTTGKAVVITAVTGAVFALSLPLVAIGDVARTRAAEGSLALDAFHVDCASTWSTGSASGAPVSPPELWVDGAAPCADGSPGDYGVAWTGGQDPTGEQVLSVADWFGILGAHPGVVIGGRVQHVAAVLAQSFPWAPAVSGPELIAATGAEGAGAGVGEPNRGGALLALHATVTSFLPQQLGFWIVLVPLGVAVWVRSRHRQSGRRPLAMGAMLAVPSVWAVTMVLVSPTGAAAAAAPAATLAWLISLWVLAAAPLRVSSFAAWSRAEDTRPRPYPVRAAAVEPDAPAAAAVPAAGEPLPGAAVVAAADQRSRGPRRPARPAAKRPQPSLGPGPLASFLADHPDAQPGGGAADPGTSGHEQSEPVDLRDQQLSRAATAEADPKP